MKKTNQLAKDFSKALSRLKEAVIIAKTDLENDGIIQRFEFTFELCWKLLKAYMAEQGIFCNSPKSCLKEAYKARYVSNESTWLDMLADRNSSTHIYDQPLATEIVGRIKEKYVKELSEIESYLKSKLS